MTVSVSIIAKNEGQSITKCLESVKDADEIVVCDTGSKDNTCEIASRYTSKVYTDYAWNDSFAEARNHANSKCTGDWILTIDCDNRLVEGMAAVKKEIEKAEAIGAKTISLGIYMEDGNRFSHWLPYLYKRDPEIFWKGACHNYLTRDDKHTANLSLSCWHSPSHAGDQDRTFRILKSEVSKNGSSLIREKYYLAREYYNRRDYDIALYWFQEYFKGAYWGAEMADAYLLMAHCCWQLQRGDEARAYCLTALGINTHFKECILFLAEMSGPINRERWLEFAELADNSNVLFRREKTEWRKTQYDDQFSADSNMKRYWEIHEEIGRIVGDCSALDIGCGVGALAQHIKHYRGFDISSVGVKISNHPNTWVGSAYEKQNFIHATYYVCTEVLEHLDDLQVIANIPAGQKFVFSVPSFDDESHIRMFNMNIIKIRYGQLLDIHRVTRYNWRDGRWQQGGALTQSYILLVESTKRATAGEAKALTAAGA